MANSTQWSGLVPQRRRYCRAYWCRGCRGGSSIDDNLLVGGMLLLCAILNQNSFYCAAVINPREDPTEPQCVNSHRNDFLCTTRPVNTALLQGRRRATDEDADDLVYDDFAYNYFFESHYRDYGVRQRVDGSDSEKEAVRQVMQEMEDYFLYEVFALDAYAGVRGRCKNTHELCAFWTSVGECDTNRGFMLENCAASCRLCLLLFTEYA